MLTTLKLLNNLGFLVNKKKSVLLPLNRAEFLEIILDSVNMSLELRERKREKKIDLLNHFQLITHCSIRQWASLIGSLNSCCVAIEYAQLYMEKLKRVENLSLEETKDNFDKRMVIPRCIKPDLDWWISKVSSANNPIRRGLFVKEIFSDASTLAWGAFCEGIRARGYWKEVEKNFHINQLKLIVAFMALKCFAKDLRDCEILLRVNNSTAVAYIDKMGGT